MRLGWGPPGCRAIFSLPLTPCAMCMTWDNGEGDTHHLVLADPLCGLDGSVQAGLADVDILGVQVAGQQPQQGPQVDVVIIIHMAEPPGGKAGPSGARQGGHCQGMGVEGLLRPTHFLPDSMKRSYSTAILQDRAWRLWAAEQLVLTTLPVGGEGCEWAWGSPLGVGAVVPPSAQPPPECTAPAHSARFFPVPATCCSLLGSKGPWGLKGPHLHEN